MPNGGTAARCQARKKNGVQCGSPCRDGFTKCWKHGPGSAKRERPVQPGESRTQKVAAADRSPGRPRADGLEKLLVTDEDWKLNAHVREILNAEGNIDDTRIAMATLHALLSREMARAPQYEEAAAELDRWLTEIPELQIRSMEEAQEAANITRSIQKLRAGLIFHFERVRDTSETIVRSAHRRADTRNKDANTRLLEQFLKWTVLLRNVIWEQIPDARVLDAIERVVQKEILAPMGIEVDFPALAAADDRSDELEDDPNDRDEDLFL